MTTLAVPRHEEAQIALVPQNYADLLKRPMLAIPAPIRPAALKLWAMNKHLAGLETPMALTAAIAVWIEDHGLDPADIPRIVKRLTHPLKMQAFKFASDLTTALANEVAESIKEARNRREANERQEIIDQAKRDRVILIADAIGEAL